MFSSCRASSKSQNKLEYLMILGQETYHNSLKERPGINKEIQRDKAEKYWREIESKIRESLPNILIEATESLTDKESFGDIDIIIESGRVDDEDNIEIVNSLADMSLVHTRVPRDTVDHFVLKMRDNSEVSVDFIRAKNKVDFETKKIFFAKYPVSSVLSTLAHNLGFSYTQDGFYYTNTNIDGKSQNILLTKDLKKAIDIMGLDSAKFDDIKTIADVEAFIQTSHYFSPEQFRLSNLSSARREHLNEVDPFRAENISNRQILKLKRERVLYASLAAAKTSNESSLELQATRCIENLKINHPNEYHQIQVNTPGITEL